MTCEWKRGTTPFLAAGLLVVAWSVGSGASGQTQQPPDARRAFQIGLTALHNFEYEDANEAFRRARTIDPGFVMAYWGEAMMYFQTLWRHDDVAAARQALAALGPTPQARAGNARTPKEKAYLSAVEVLIAEGDAATRSRTYADAMARVAALDPADPDAGSLHALALLGTMSRSLIGYEEAGEGHSHGLAGSDIQKQVAAILQKILASHPRHPGALHYLLHDYDDPGHARLVLAAARTYAKVAPESSHALHMPSHIFLQLGLWHDAAASDRAAFAESIRAATRKGRDAATRNYHALAWLEYELLQLGRYREARETIAQLEPIVKATGSNALLTDLSSMRARFVVETRQWDLMAAERNFGNVNELFAIGASATRRANAGLAEMARQGLADRARSAQEGDLRPAIAIMEREVAALVELAAGRRDRAVQILREATDAERALPAPLGLPAPVKPAPELLGEVLVEAGRPAEAVAAFEQALRRNANRTLSVLGLARAEAARGRADAARRHYRAVLANLDGADAGIADVKEATEAIGRAGGAGGAARSGRPGRSGG